MENPLVVPVFIVAILAVEYVLGLAGGFDVVATSTLLAASVLIMPDDIRTGMRSRSRCRDQR